MESISDTENYPLKCEFCLKVHIVPAPTAIVVCPECEPEFDKIKQRAIDKDQADKKVSGGKHF